MNARPEPTLFVAVGPSTRRRIEHAIEGLIALLDQLDDDPDLESANDDEPWLGWEERRAGAGWNEYGRPDPGDDREGEDEHDEDGGDAEPELGFVGIATGWRAGEEADDREGDDEGEPNGDEGDVSWREGEEDQSPVRLYHSDWCIDVR